MLYVRTSKIPFMIVEQDPVIVTVISVDGNLEVIHAEKDSHPSEKIFGSKGGICCERLVQWGTAVEVTTTHILKGPDGYDRPETHQFLTAEPLDDIIKKFRAADVVTLPVIGRKPGVGLIQSIRAGKNRLSCGR